MGRCFKMMALLLALLWVPIVSHCTWEHLSGLEFLGCCTTAADAPDQDNDCQKDNCVSVESGHYKTEERAITVPAPALLAPLLSPQITVVTEGSASALVASTSVPVELPQRWQFISRTAAPPRAPSFAS